MRDANFVPQRIAVAYHPRLPDAPARADEVCQALLEQGFTAFECGSLYDEAFRARVGGGEFDLMIALGGDGTMLRAGHLCAPLGIPIMGINVGHFGFLVELRNQQWRELLPRLLTGKFRLEERFMLRAEHTRQGETLGRWDVINEVVVCRGKYVRPIHLKASVDNYLLATYVADGLIAATPTGSTAYALAVGGPIMPPELRNILIVPVAPHLSVDRAIILAEGAYVTIEVHTSHEAVLSVDGQAPILMQDGDSVRASAGDHTVLFVRFQDPGYFYRDLTSYMVQNPSTSIA